MKILFLSTWFPQPPDNGSKTRVHYLLRALGECHDVHLVAFMPTPDEARYLPELRAWLPRVSVVQRDPFWIDRRKAMLGYVSPRPRHVVAQHSREMAELVRETARGERFDVVVASCTPAAPYALLVPRTPRILEEHNFMTRWMEERSASESGFARRTLRRMTWLKTRRYERRLFRRFEACTMVSTQDRNSVVSVIPELAGRVHVVPNGVDLEHAKQAGEPPEPDSLVFNGALTYSANADAMRYFVGEMLPLIRRRVPGVRLRITGCTRGVDLSWVPTDGSVRLTGYLQDVRPAVRGSWACVAPLRFGGGTRLKILEAMALGVPVIATSKGAEGLEVTPEQDILIADEPRSFANQVVRLLGDPSLRSRLAAAGRRLVEIHYSWEAIGVRFGRLVEATAESGKAP